MPVVAQIVFCMEARATSGANRMGRDKTLFQTPRIRFFFIRAPRTDSGERLIIDEKNGAGSVGRGCRANVSEISLLRYGFHKKAR